MGDAWYVRMDKGDEVVAGILELCRREGIASATFTGIGGCQSAQIQTFIPQRGEFDTEEITGMLELVSLIGNVISDRDGKLYHHTHAQFAFARDGQHFVRAGHLKQTTVLYTAEIVLRPVEGGVIRRRYNPETGTGIWDFED